VEGTHGMRAVAEVIVFMQRQARPARAQRKAAQHGDAALLPRARPPTPVRYACRPHRPPILTSHHRSSQAAASQRAQHTTAWEASATYANRPDRLAPSNLIPPP